MEVDRQAEEIKEEQTDWDDIAGNEYQVYRMCLDARQLNHGQ